MTDLSRFINVPSVMMIGEDEINGRIKYGTFHSGREEITEFDPTIPTSAKGVKPKYWFEDYSGLIRVELLKGTYLGMGVIQGEGINDPDKFQFQINVGYGVAVD